MFPVQAQCFDQVFYGQDMMVSDSTGSGKTLAFALPLVESLRNQKLFGRGKLQALCLAPTRELAVQITNVFAKLRHYEKEFKIVTLYGGGQSMKDQTWQL